MQGEDERRVIHTVGWPRSGNNWTVRILSDLFHAPITYYDKGGDTQYAQFIDPKYTINMTHFSPDEFRSEYPRGKVLFVIRDPRDTIVSYRYYYNLKSIEDAIHACIEKGMNVFIAKWLAEKTNHIARYEGWHEDFVQQAMLCYYNLSTPKTQTSESNCFRVMERQKFERWADRGDRTMRKGKVGEWRKEFKRKDAKLVHDFFWAIMEHTMYENDYNWWANF